MIKSGTPRVLITTSEQPTEKEMIYYLASEYYMSANISANITSPSIYEAVHSDIAQYDSSAIYCYDNSVVRVDKRTEKDITSRIKSDMFLIFIIELISFQDAAISRTNDRVTSKLSKHKNLSLELIEKMTVEFGKTMTFWDINNFKYKTAQNLANQIISAFKTEEQLARYLRNQEFLQQLVNIKYAKNSHKETRILNLIAIFLFFVQMVPILYNILYGIVNDQHISMKKISLMMSSSALLGVVTLFVILLINLKSKSRSQ